MTEIDAWTNKIKYILMLVCICIYMRQYFNGEVEHNRNAVGEMKRSLGQWGGKNLGKFSEFYCDYYDTC